MNVSKQQLAMPSFKSTRPIDWTQLGEHRPSRHRPFHMKDCYEFIQYAIHNYIGYFIDESYPTTFKHNTKHEICISADSKSSADIYKNESFKDRWDKSLGMSHYYNEEYKRLDSNLAEQAELINFRHIKQIKAKYKEEDSE